MVDSFGDRKWIDPQASRPCWDLCECRFNVPDSKAFDVSVQKKFDFVVEKSVSDMIVKVYSSKLKEEIARLFPEAHVEVGAIVCSGFQLLRSDEKIKERLELLFQENESANACHQLKLLDGLISDRQVFQSFGTKKLREECVSGARFWPLYLFQSLNDVVGLLDDTRISEDHIHGNHLSRSESLDSPGEHREEPPVYIYAGDDLATLVPYFGPSGSHEAGCDGVFGPKWMRIMWRMNRVERTTLFRSFGISTAYDLPTPFVKPDRIINSFDFCRALCHISPEAALLKSIEWKQFETTRAILQSTSHCSSTECSGLDPTLLNLNSSEHGFPILNEAAKCGDQTIIQKLLQYGARTVSGGLRDDALTLAAQVNNIRSVPTCNADQPLHQRQDFLQTDRRNAEDRSATRAQHTNSLKLSEVRHWFIMEHRSLIAYTKKREDGSLWIEQRILEALYKPDGSLRGYDPYKGWRSDFHWNYKLISQGLPALDADPQVAWKTSIRTLRHLCNKDLPRDLNEALMFLLLARAMSVFADSNCGKSLHHGCSCCTFSDDLRRWQILFENDSSLDLFRGAAKHLWNIDMFHEAIPGVSDEDQLNQFQDIASRIVDNLREVLELMDGAEGSFLRVQNNWKDRNITSFSAIEDESISLGMVRADLQAFHHPEYGSSTPTGKVKAEQHLSETSSGRRSHSLAPMQILVILVGGAIFATVISFILGE